MPYYCVNKNAQPTGEHEVHDTGIGNCNRLPHPSNRIDLGFHVSCQQALIAAKSYFYNVDGCYYCIPNCHKK